MNMNAIQANAVDRSIHIYVMFRYDVALDVNVMGVKYLCQLAKKCANLEVFLHVSTGKLRSMRLERTLDKLTCKLS